VGLTVSASQQLVIGIPQALLYHRFAPMWLHFFRALNCRVLVSPKTNRQILEQGIRAAIDETCLAVKIFLGHVAHLADKVDYIFIPRVVSLYKGEDLCVKFFALGDIVRNTFPDIKILEYTVDMNENQREFCGILKVGLQICSNPVRIFQAYWQSLERLHLYDAAQLDKQQRELASPDAPITRILLAGHPYILYDALLGKQVTALLQAQDVQIVYSDIVDRNTARTLSCNLSTDLYWSLNKEILGAIEYYKHAVSGIVFLVSFPCGPDALVVDLCKNILTDIPLCVIVMDELQADAGLKTRLESFVDILRMMPS
jgi:predicted nucleotide-binding protein (sugar kinase/HSP70/actin superfamily)